MKTDVPSRVPSAPESGQGKRVPPSPPTLDACDFLLKEAKRYEKAGPLNPCKGQGLERRTQGERE